MLAKTHLAFGLLSALLVMPFVNTGNKIIFFSIVLVASILPDIDSPNSKISNKIPIIPKIISIFTKHRGIFHTILMAAALTILVGFFSYTYAIALFIGYFSHLLIDGFTLSGINFLHPVAKLHLSGFIETGTAGEWIVFFIIIAGIVLKMI